MHLIPDDTIDRWIRETSPYGDLTTSTLSIGEKPGIAEFSAREHVTICGTEEAARVFEKCGARAEILRASGREGKKGDRILIAHGTAASLHVGWKVSINILEYASGIATRTRRLVQLARAVAPAIQIAATCKTFPGTRELSAKAVFSGGGALHRSGLSETVLVFDHHTAFLDHAQNLPDHLPAFKRRAVERKFIVEAPSPESALSLARSGADGIQFDKMPPALLAECVVALRAIRPDLLIIAAGGINEHNAAEIAATGVDVLATSAIYFGKPADIAASIFPSPPPKS